MDFKDLEGNKKDIADNFKKKLDKDPSNFSLWMKYIKSLENLENRKRLDSTLKELLNKFPYLYGYWIKFANVEYNNLERCKQRYEQGLDRMPTCVELWLDYCLYMANQADPQEAIMTFERALAAVGSFYDSLKIWRKYMEFEESQNNYNRIGALYTRILREPIKQLDLIWEEYIEFVSNRPISDLITKEEFENLKKEVNLFKKKAGIGHQQLNHSQLIQKQKEIIVMWRKRLFGLGKKKLEKISFFEENITRSFYHVLRLDELELQNWRKYLSFVQNDTTFSNIEKEKLFKRCLVPCCHYIEFYKRFCSFYLGLNQKDNAKKILEEATTIFLKNRPESFVALAEFEEFSGNKQVAFEILNKLCSSELGKANLSSLMSYFFYLKRNKKLEEIKTLFETHRDLLPVSGGRDFFDIQYAKFIKNEDKDLEKAKELFAFAVKRSPNSTNARLAQIQFEIEHGDITKCENFFRETLKCRFLEVKDKVDVLEKFLNFAKRFCAIETVFEIENMLFFEKVNDNIEEEILKKRKREESTSEGEPLQKRIKTENILEKQDKPGDYNDLVHKFGNRNSQNQ